MDTRLYAHRRIQWPRYHEGRTKRHYIPFTTPYTYTGKNLVVLVVMEAQLGMGGYFDRFYVQAQTGKADRTRTHSIYGETVDTETLRPSNGTLT